MTHIRIILLGSLLTASLAFTESKTSADGGTPPPMFGPIDAGMFAVPASLMPKTAQQNEQFKNDIAEMRREAAANTQALSAQLKSIDKQLAEMHADMKAAEARRLESEKAAVEVKSRTAEAVQSIANALQQLSSGSTATALPAITFAESVFSGAALRDLAIARQALANGDLGTTRNALVQSIADAEANRY